MSTNHHRFTYRPEIDGLRALAILLVVCFHALPGTMSGGFIGVDIFFVISGYLISGIIIKELEAKSFSLAEFYRRRCRRILPALLVMLLTIWTLGWLFLMPEEFKELGYQVLAGATFSENFLLAQQAGYFDNASIRKPLLHLWSLGVEEQFYIFWPLLLMVASRLRMRMSLLITGLLIASFGFALYYETRNAVAAFYMLPSRFWELLCGAMLSYAEMHGLQVWPRLKKISVSANIQIMLAVAAITGFALLFKQDMFFSAWWKIIPCIAAMLIISAGRKASFAKIILGNAPTVYIGRISYPLYLWHWPLLSLAWIVNEGHPTLGIKLAAVALAFALASLTYIILEKPVQKISLRYAPYQVITVSLALIAVVSFLGYGGMTERSWRFTAPWPTVLESADIDPESAHMATDRTWWTLHNYSNDQKCATSSWDNHFPADYCRLTDDQPRIAIIGDSHANHLVPGLEALNDPVFSKVIQISYGGCTYFGGVQITSRTLTADKEHGCTEANLYFADKIKNDPMIKYVIVSSYWRTNADFDQSRPDTNRVAALPGTPFDPTLPKMDLLREGISHMIDVMEASNKRVIIFLDVPNLGLDPVDCVAFRRFSMITEHPPCRIARDQVVNVQEREQRTMIKSLAEKHPKLIVFDPIPYMCDADFCYAVHDRKLLYRDSNHMEPDGSLFLARALMETLRKKPQDRYN